MLLSMNQTVAQTDSFSVFTCKSPQFFTKSKLPARLQYNLKNNDTSFCTITLYKTQPATINDTADIKGRWMEYAVKRLTKADKAPAKIYTGEVLDGWASTVAVGNFYEKKKKGVVMINMFTKNKITACVVYVMSDRIFMPVADTFSRNLHFINY